MAEEQSGSFPFTIASVLYESRTFTGIIAMTIMPMREKFSVRRKRKSRRSRKLKRML